MAERVYVDRGEGRLRLLLKILGRRREGRGRCATRTGRLRSTCSATCSEPALTGSSGSR
jgi:hypothetical protein